ncbi:MULTISPECIES: hypothetical protein [Deinococcus]|uniref:Tetratricopeptide repeat protein n=1 Tax=Deinococcus ruber TaxID=1848197 RepID=A0A918F1D5_9DEIO|nr:MULTISPECIES: hypothetical protein [Deinococcus]ULH16646.1 hypothetical protein MF271_08755 [Deinococcus sp. KNUC1210]GGQ96165.1 hypothetical protein GCM10008957_05450 [Deinococcus ruber]
MNYAASLAVVVLLTFFFPLAVRVGMSYDVSRSSVVTTMLAILIFVAATVFIRWQVARTREASATLELARAQVNREPDNPRAYYVQGEHLAGLLLRLGRRREAAAVIDRYASLGGARESEITALRELLMQAERRQKRGS